MNYDTYQIIHVVGLAMLALGLGGMLGEGSNRKVGSIFQGIGLLVILVSGFGMLAKAGMGFPHFAMVKFALWLVIGASPVLFRKLKVPAAGAFLFLLVLVAILAWLGRMKPVLW
jgi:hypothetical protein